MYYCLYSFGNSYSRLITKLRKFNLRGLLNFHQNFIQPNYLSKDNFHFHFSPLSLSLWRRRKKKYFQGGRGKKRKLAAEYRRNSMVLHSFRIVVTNSRRNSCCIRRVKLNGLVAEFQLSAIQMDRLTNQHFIESLGFVCSFASLIGSRAAIDFSR